MPRIAPKLWVMITLGFVWRGSGGATVAAADPPRIETITPSGACRGVATEVVIAGANLAGRPRWLGPFGAEVEAAAGPVAAEQATTWRLRITPGADVPVGVYLVRVQTEGGLSNPSRSRSTRFPHVAEVEENSTFDRAQPVERPGRGRGAKRAGRTWITSGSRGTKGERVVVDAVCARIGSGVDPSIRLSTAGDGSSPRPTTPPA